MTPSGQRATAQAREMLQLLRRPAIPLVALLWAAPGFWFNDSHYLWTHGVGVLMCVTAPVAIWALQGGIAWLAANRAGVAAVWALALGASARSACLALLGTGHSPSEIRDLLIMRVPTSVIWVGMGLLVAQWWETALASQARLTGAYEQAQATTDLIRARTLQTDEQLVEQEARVRGLVRDISAQLVPGMARPALVSLVESIDLEVQERIRPASHLLASKPEPLEPAGATALFPRPGQVFVQSLALWPYARPFNWEGAALMAIPATAASILAQVGRITPAGAGIAVSWLLVMLTAVWAADSWVATAARRLPLLPAYLLVAAGYLAFVPLEVAGFTLANRMGTPSFLQPYWLPAFTALWLGGGSGFAARWQQCELLSTRLLTAMQADLSTARRHLWASRRRLALWLHGQVQAALVATAILLRRRLRDCETLDEELIAEVQAGLAEATLARTSSAADPRVAIQRLLNLWDGILTSQLTVDDDAQDLLGGSTDTSEACVEVLRELLLNAVRHGAAQHVTVQLYVPSAGVVRLVVCESGAELTLPGATESVQPREPGGPGLGHDLINSLTTTWSVHQAWGQRVTVANFDLPKDRPTNMEQR